MSMRNTLNEKESGKSLSLSPHARFLWFLVLALIIIDALGLWITGLSLNLSLLCKYLFMIILLVGLVPINARAGSDPRIAAILHIEGLTLACSILTLIMSYIAIGLRRPLADASFVAADRALGFDWLAFYTWVASHPFIHGGLLTIYGSFMPEMALLQFVLGMRRQFTRGWELLWLFVVSCVSCIAIRGVLADRGCFGSFHVEMNTPYVR